MCRNSLIILTLSLLLGACAASRNGADIRAGEATANQGPQPDQVIGSVNGTPIRRADLSSELQSELKKIDNEAKQRAFHVLWGAVDDIAAERLIEQEAKERGMSVTAFRKAEIDSKVAGPSDDEVQKIYDANREVIRVPFDVAAPHLRQQMTAEERSELERILVQQLRHRADIRHAVPAPDLPRFAIDVGNAPQWGPADAPVTLVEFSDFECPYCARGRDTVKKLKEIYPEALRVVFRDFPLEQHKNARRAAEMAQCAHEQDTFWPYHDKLFDNTRALDEESLTKYAEALDLDSDKMSACMASGRPKEAVETHRKAGEKFGVDGTPAIFINGIKLIGLLPIPMMRALIDSELERVLSR